MTIASPFRFAAVAPVPVGMHVHRARISPDGTTLRMSVSIGVGPAIYLSIPLTRAEAELPRSIDKGFEGGPKTRTEIITDDNFLGCQTGVRQRAPNSAHGGALFSNNGTRVELHRTIEPRAVESSLLALNCHNEAVGSVTWGKDESARSRPMLFTGYTIRSGITPNPMPQLLPLPEGYPSATAITIDDAGNVLGTAVKGEGEAREVHAFVWPRAVLGDAAPKPVRLRNHSGRQTHAANFALHELSTVGGLVVVGTTEVNRQQVSAAVWSVDDATGSHTPLGALGGSTCCANAGIVDSHGRLTVYGGSTTRDSQLRATLWDHRETAHDLNTLVNWEQRPLPADLVLTEVIAIDDRGRLVVMASAVFSAYLILLEPVT